MAVKHEILPISLILILLFSLFIAACANSDGNNDDTQKNADVSMQCTWIHEYFSALFYAAVENGHFRDANINLDLIEGGFGESRHIEPIAQVVGR
jgi:hypothetical protein